MITLTDEQWEEIRGTLTVLLLEVHDNRVTEPCAELLDKMDEWEEQQPEPESAVLECGNQ